MFLRRLQLIIITIAGLALTGLGHHFVATQRDAYPIDGYVFYLGAALCGVWLWRTLSRISDAIWLALRDTLRAALQVMGDALRLIVTSLRDLLPQLPVRAVLISVIVLNIGGALIAQFAPMAAWLWLAAWFGSALIVGVYAWPRLRPKIKRTTKTPTAASTTPLVIEEAPAPAGRLNPIGLLAALAVMLVGQGLIGSAVQSTDSSLTPLPFISALRLDLPGDANGLLAGWALLISGALGLGWVTRRLTLSDYVPFSATPRSRSASLTSRWLLVAVGALALWFIALNTISSGATGTGGLWPWLMAIGALAACWWQIDRARGVRWAVKIDRREALALIVATLAITVVLTYRLGDVPNNLWGDEGGYWTLARDIARGATSPDVFGLGAYAFPMGGSLYQAAWLGLLGQNLIAWRWSGVFALICVVVTLYFLVRATLGQRTAWLSLAALTVMPYTLTFARIGYTQSLAMLPVVLTLALLWTALRHDSRFLAFLAGAASGLSFLTHPSAQLAILLAAAWLIGLLIMRRLPVRMVLMLGAAWLIGTVIVASPAVAYGTTHASEAYAGKFVESAFNNLFYARDIVPAEQLARLESVHVGQQEIFIEAGTYAQLLLRGTFRTALSFHTSALVRDPFMIGALAEPFGLLYLIGLAWCVARIKRPGYAIWPLWLIGGGFVLSAMSAYPPRAGLMLPIVPALAVLSALGLIASLDLIGRVLGGVPERVKVLGAIGVLGVLSVIGLRTYFVEMPERYQPDLENAMMWAAQAMPRNSTLMLITSADLPTDYRPWGVREFDLPVAFMRLRPDELSSNGWRVACANACMIFVQATEQAAALPGLREAFGAGTLVQYPPNGEPQFYRFQP